MNKLSFKMKHPGKVKFFHPSKNGNLTVDDVASASKKVFTWACNANHEWQYSAQEMGKSKGCPYCTHARPSPEYNFATLHPAIASDWHPTKNHGKLPQDYLPQSGFKAVWSCKKNKTHIYRMRIADRTRNGDGCPYCSGRRISQGYNLLTEHPVIAAFVPSSSEGWCAI
jgi:hypothetical protein